MAATGHHTPGHGGGSGGSTGGGSTGGGDGAMKLQDMRGGFDASGTTANLDEFRTYYAPCTNKLTIDGTIKADGGKPYPSQSSAGSGGGVYIVCQGFSGSGFSQSTPSAVRRYGLWPSRVEALRNTSRVV